MFSAFPEHETETNADGHKTGSPPPIRNGNEAGCGRRDLDDSNRCGRDAAAASTPAMVERLRLAAAASAASAETITDARHGNDSFAAGVHWFAIDIPADGVCLKLVTDALEHLGYIHTAIVPKSAAALERGLPMWIVRHEFEGHEKPRGGDEQNAAPEPPLAQPAQLSPRTLPFESGPGTFCAGRLPRLVIRCRREIERLETVLVRNNRLSNVIIRTPVPICPVPIEPHLDSFSAPLRTTGQDKLKIRMPAQILLQGKLLGAEDFLLAPPADRDNRAFEARSMWLVLIGEGIPRALLAELQLPPLMLGSSGGDRFVVILPDQERADRARQFLERVAQSLSEIGAGKLNLVWSATENLGDWTIVRKRLQDGMTEGARPRAATPGYFDAFAASGPGADRIPRDLRDAAIVAWSFDFPALIAAAAGEQGRDTPHKWEVGNNAAIPVTRHGARNGEAFASTKELARRAHGQKLWGVLRGEIDDYGTRMRRVQSVEEHVHLSMLYKQFLAGEMELLCSQGEYFQRVTILHSGASDFAVYGSWDALVGFARELERVFSRFAQESLKDLPGAEAKTITMALTIAEPGAPLARVYEDCARDLEVARASDKDCLHLLGKVLEWKQLNEAADLKDALVHLIEEFRSGRQFLTQLRNLYKKVETPDPGGALPVDSERLTARALRFQRRFARVASRREREFQKLRSHLMKELAGRNMRGGLKLRPEGLIALEWARLAED